MSPKSEFHTRLVSRMKFCGLSAAELARNTGIAPTNISRYIKGRIPATDEFWRIAKALGVSMEWLYTGEERETDRQYCQEETPVYPPEAADEIKRSLAITGSEMAKLAKLLQREWGDKL